MLFTIGHSNHPWSEFVQLLPSSATLIDIRSHPTSRHPQYNRQYLERMLGVRYEWWPPLGGWDVRHAEFYGRFPGVDLEPYLHGHFPKQRIAQHTSPTDTPSWTNVGLYDFAWFMGIDEFRVGATDLIRQSQFRDLAIMCCEAVPWRCHRSMVTDYTLYKGVDAVHLFGRPTKTKGYRISTKLHSSMIGNRLERYPGAVIAAWQAWD